MTRSRSRWSILRSLLIHHRSPIARLAYRHNFRWVDRLQEAYMRRLIRAGTEPDLVVGPDGRVIPRHRSVSIPPSLLALRDRRNRVPSSDDIPDTRPADLNGR